MKNLYRFLLTSCVLLFLTVGLASADSLVPFSLCTDTCSGGGTVVASFELPAGTLVPETFDAGVVFTITPTNLNINGAPSTDFLAFYNSTFFGGFGAFSSGTSFDLNLTGPQLFFGSESSPTITPGSFLLTDFSGGKFNLVVGTVATPEPSAVFLLSLGLAAIGLLIFRAKRNVPVSAA